MRLFSKPVCLSLSVLVLALSACSSGGGKTNSSSSATTSEASVTSQTGSSSSSVASSETSSSTGNGSQTEKTYTITWTNYDGKVLEKDENVKAGTMPTYDGDRPTKPEDEEYAYSFKDWYPSIYAANKDQTYVAQFERTKVFYKLIYTLNGGTNSPNNPSKYRVGTSFTFYPATKTGYSFEGWFWSSGVQITEITPETTGDIYLNARWKAVKNTLSVTSEDTSKGTVGIVSGEGYSGELITVKATPALGYKFGGWYNKTTKVSGEATYTFTMPTNDYALVAKFAFDEEYAVNHGMIPSFSSDQKTVTYGLYPNKYVSDETMLAALGKLKTPEANGYYLYDGDYYAKTVAKPYKSNYQFKDRTTIVAGTTYWFKCEPLQWDVLSNTNGECFLMASDIIDAGCYYNSQEKRIIDNWWVYPNNYQYSDIRAWLNGYDGSDYSAGDYGNDNFVRSAFGLGDDYVKTKTVDNSPETTNSPANSFYCNDTEDAVFLGSYQDFVNTDYGFPSHSNSDDSRECIPTDWAKARGAVYRVKYYPYAGSYWTRSPDTLKNGEYTVWVVNDVGGIGFDSTEWDANGIRPGICLKTTK
ncbi:MAG: DUF6273 domain-containing protein [Bacilli bacterium]|nr:DUF6273 domain-containing protein [Bacilli bacterium]